MKVLLMACGLALGALPVLANDDHAQSIDSSDAAIESLNDMLEDTAEHRHQRGWQQARRVCKKVNVTADQKQALKAAFTEHRQNTAQPRADLKAARKQFIELIKDEQAVAADASVAVSEGVTAKTALSQARGDLATKVMFEILTPEQRKPALRCLKALKKARHGRHGHGSHHGGHGDQGSQG